MINQKQVDYSSKENIDNQKFDSSEWGISFKVKDNQIQNSINAMIDSIALSKCKKVLKTNSALSSWAKIFNPKIEIYRLTIFGINDSRTWFPIHHIKYVNKDFFK